MTLGPDAFRKRESQRRTDVRECVFGLGGGDVTDTLRKDDLIVRDSSFFGNLEVTEGEVTKQADIFGHTGS